MWFLVTVVKGSRYYDSDSQIDNQLIVSDTTDMIVTGYSAGGGAYRFEMRKGNECFVLQDLPKGLEKSAVVQRFQDLATQLGARGLSLPV
jgi:hypothetical protein